MWELLLEVSKIVHKMMYDYILILVKLIISAGTLFFALIGDDKSSHYLEVGQPIWDIKAADSKSCPGDVLVSHSAWKYINLKEYNYIALDDKNHIKVSFLIIDTFKKTYIYRYKV